MKSKLRYTSLFIIYYTLFYISLQGQNVIRIPEDHPTIQEGLDYASTNTTILVSPGIYYENLIWPSYTDGIKLIGIDGSAKTIIDGNYKGRVVTMEGATPPDQKTISIATLLKGFTIQHGKTLEIGCSGLLCSYASPTLYDLRIIENKTNEPVGAGACLIEFSGVIDNCLFKENKIENSSSGFGAGLYMRSLNFEIKNCIFENNSINTVDWGIGGGLFIELFSENGQQISKNISITNCKFLGNTTEAGYETYGAGLYIDDIKAANKNIVTIDSCYFCKNNTKIGLYQRGGAIYSDISNLNITNSQFIQNTSEQGASVYYGHNIIFSYKSKIENTVFSKNQIYGINLIGGSAIYVELASLELSLINVVMDNNQNSAISINNNYSNIEMIHCTTFNNELINNLSGSTINAQNSIFWNKTSTEFHQFHPSINLNHCIVKGGYPGTGNLDKDPLMIDTFLPVPGINSPCLNAGVLIPSINTDIKGFPRPIPVNSLPDIGAYEMDQYFAHVLVKYYYDINQNGIKDINERYLSFGNVKDHNGQTHVNYSENGSYIIFQQGMASIQYVEDITSDWKSSGQIFYQFNVNSAQFSEKVEIGLYPKNAQSKLSTMVFGNNFRCGEEVRFTFTLTNNGTTIESGSYWLKIDERLDSIWFTNLLDATISKHEFSWRYQDLYPGESITKEFFVLAPRITNPNELGEIYKLCHGVSGLSPMDDNCYLAELRCAFDPNDKFSIPQREDQYSLKAEPMVYTIRFQNTGNDYARNVIIRDNIDRSFNLNSLKILQTSHPDILEVSHDDARELIFSFKNIFLPDSTTDYEGSNGYVIYSLEYNEGLPENTVVNNTANIFFDFNPAIVTNTTNNIVVKEYPTSTSDPNENRIFVYPNPATNYLQFSKNVDKSILFNLQGQMIHQASNTNNLNIHSAPGTYILRLEAEGHFYYHKVLVIGN